MNTFDPEKHEYKIDGKVVPSVTQIANFFTADKYEMSIGNARAAAYRGTEVHRLTQLYDFGFLTEDEELDEELVPYLTAYENFIADYNPKWKYVEAVLYGNEDHPLAGTVDRIGEIDGETVIVDIKTTASMNRESKLALATQLLGYRLLAYLNYGLKINVDKCFGLQLQNDGHYKIHKVKDIEDFYGFDVVEVFQCLELLNAIKRGFKKERKLINE